MSSDIPYASSGSGDGYGRFYASACVAPAALLSGAAHLGAGGRSGQEVSAAGSDLLSWHVGVPHKLHDCLLRHGFSWLQ